MRAAPRATILATGVIARTSRSIDIAFALVAAQRSRNKVNSALTPCGTAHLVAEVRSQAQGRGWLAGLTEPAWICWFVVAQYSKPNASKLAAGVIRWLCFSLGIAVAAAYETMVIIAPPSDWHHMRARSFMLMYFAGPALMIMAAYWVGNWIAQRIDPQPHRGAKTP